MELLTQGVDEAGQKFCFAHTIEIIRAGGGPISTSIVASGDKVECLICSGKIVITIGGQYENNTHNDDNLGDVDKCCRGRK